MGTLRSRKRSESVLGRTFTDAAALTLAQQFAASEARRLGLAYGAGEARPAAGAFVLVDDADITAMLDLLVDLGLPRFEDATPVDVFITPTVARDGNFIAPAPVESDLVFVAPRTAHDPVRLIFRVVVMDPLFVDGSGERLQLAGLPPNYVAAVLNTLNPAVFFRTIGLDAVRGLFARAGKLAPTFQAAFATAVKDWQGRPAPGDEPTLRQFLTLGLLHEFVHALALNLPDLADGPAAADAGLSTGRYISMLSEMSVLHGSVVFIKNLFKALHAVEGQPADVATQNQVVRVLALEMFCDRFAMYLYETHRALQAYRQAMPGYGEAFPFDAMRVMEREREADRDRFARRHELDESRMRALEEGLEAAAREHVYVSAFGDPPLLSAERASFGWFLDELRRLDREKTINTFTLAHTNGDFFRASRHDPFVNG